ncbi:MAG: molybdate ABC transporter substrate-binding protein [Gordonia sp. (in: high G+C Gram-positive bacteria)]
MTGRAVAVAALLSLGLLAGCSSSSDSGSSDSSGSVPSGTVTYPAESGTVSVAAAASLQSAFTELADVFERRHDGVTVALSFAGSATIATQINQGSPTDVFASADEKNMTKIADHALNPTIFATNTLVIVTAPGNPKGITGLKDLANPQIKTALCAAAQPCGNASVEVERHAGVRITPVTEEPSVTAVLTKVTTGQVDAGLVYVTDAKSAGTKVATVTDPAFASVVNKYPIAVLKGSENEAIGKEFVDLVLSPEGKKVLTRLGFGAP